jgi:Holliday junction resolvase
MGLSQRQKGKRVEREACKLLQSLGYEAERSVQFCGRSEDSADVRHNVPGVRIEIKGGYDNIDVSGTTVDDWIVKVESERQTGNKDNALVLWKRSRKSWLAIFRVQDIIVLSADIKASINYVKGT